MRLCKYCNKPIAEKDIWNPDNDGNGYHHKCLVDMEFKARDKQIYDKGKTDVLDKIRAEIEQAEIKYDKSPFCNDMRTDAEKCADWWEMSKMIILQIIDRYRNEVNE